MNMIGKVASRLNRVSAVGVWVVLHKIAQRSMAGGALYDGAYLGADIVGVAMTSKAGNRLAKAISRQPYQVGETRRQAMEYLTREMRPDLYPQRPPKA